jgi:uncharacterized NAD-dependent epimerase/dehydratase family protein
MDKNRKKAIVLASKAFGTLEGKTANDVVIYDGEYRIAAVIDETRAGKDAGEVLGISRKNIPIVASLKEALKHNPDVLIIGIAPPGGALPEEWRSTIREAIRKGLDIVSGLHFFFSDDQEFSQLAKKHGVKLIDLRKPPKHLEVLKELVKVEVPVVAILSTDAATGKNIVMMELVKEAEKRGLNVGTVATGQTMMLIRGDAGAAIDAIPGDFIPGTVGRMTSEVAKMGKDLVIIEGQASLSHPAYGVETLAILHGSQPDAIILVHDPFRKTRDGFPKLEVPKPKEEIRLIETMCPKTKVVGIAISYIYNYDGFKSDEEIRKAITHAEKETNLPSTDVQRFGVQNLFDALDRRFKKIKKPLRKT